MTVGDVIEDFKLLADFNVGSDAAGFVDDEIQSILDDAQYDLIEAKMYGDSTSRLNFEGNQKRVSELESLIATAVTGPSSSSGTKQYDYYVDLSNLSPSFLYYVDSQSELTRSSYPSVTDGNFHNKFIGYSNISNFFDNGTQQHFLNPRVFLGGDTLYIKVDSFTTGISNILLQYIKRPTSIRGADDDTDLDLDDQLRGELVSIAVRRAHSIINPEQYKVSNVEQQKMSD